LYGDGKYGAKDNDKIALHCFKLSFTHPNGGELTFISLPSGGVWDAFLANLSALEN
jgi:23S rRNA-/tRNA-specific pseudouridylate synthase